MEEQSRMQERNIPGSDQINKNKTIYEASGFEVFWRNFIAGAGRAVGGVFVYLIILVVTGSLINTYLLPKILPLVNTLQSSVESLQTITQPSQSQFNQNEVVDNILNQPQLQNILNQAK